MEPSDLSKTKKPTPPYDPWAPSITKKLKLDDISDEELDFSISKLSASPIGSSEPKSSSLIGGDEKMRISSGEVESKIDLKIPIVGDDKSISSSTLIGREEKGSSGLGICGGDEKIKIEENESELLEVSSLQSSSEPEQTPRSSIDDSGEKSDEKGESESSKPVTPAPSLPQSTNATNGISSVNFFSSSNLSKRCVTLQMLLAGNILKPGEGSMSLEYHCQKFIGDLLENGQIRSQETSQVFSSPSAWATACKQIINPDKPLKKSGCGWASIKYKGLKLDYYKAVWFKRLREGSIDVKNISNGASTSSSDEDEDETQHCVLKFGEHFDNSPRHMSAQLIGAKVLISCTEFKEMERLQPFHVKVSAEALALADFHSNITNTEVVGYISGQWNGDQNTLRMESIHPCRVLMPNSTSVECDNERNRLAAEIHKLGHEVVGWYHSHPKAPPIPSKDDIGRQLDYQIMMKGASEASYIPCVGIIISPLCYRDNNESERESKSALQFFWVMPPPENRPLEMGRPMHVEYETFPSTEFDPRKLAVSMSSLLQFYRKQGEIIEVTELSDERKFDRLKDTLSSWLPALKLNSEFWQSLLRPETPQETPSSSSLLIPHKNEDVISTSIKTIKKEEEEENENEEEEKMKVEEEEEEEEEEEAKIKMEEEEEGGSPILQAALSSISSASSPGGGEENMETES